MDMQSFVTELEKRNFGVVSFNTYMRRGENFCFIMIAEKGDAGKFFKSECLSHMFNDTLQSMMLKVLYLKGEV